MRIKKYYLLLSGLFFLNVSIAQKAVYIRGTGNYDNSKTRIVKVDGNVIFNNVPAAYNSISSRGLALTILDAETYQHISSINYDTYGSSSESNVLAQALNNISKGQIGILSSRDAWESQVTSELRIAAERLGLFKLSKSHGHRNPYAAIFKGANNGFNNSMVIEVLQPANAQANFATISTMLIEDSFIANDIRSVLLKADGNKNEVGLALDYLGNVGIGLDNPDEKLTVKGNIHSQEVRVDLAGVIAPDYVFEKNYDLISISEVEKFINLEGHLPKIPSAEELEQEGLNLKEMNLKLLEKIEELTLYIIEQEKRLTSLEGLFKNK
ncbi:interleukin-like EMT inducer protein [Leeuwenhoekiella aestuarii]|uniref:interleukin-like EMT inducer domain-containing protein n=1 Tax=Leeuwenhoekiella aestuarii TaxID=2249426 RepID=UPI000FFE98FB|nr:interleukin-like EMT inducer domain-containing protein [Leeuwenhoekiella aestuarii]RXG11376.1 interleukin-like EMT inducer protein [Leeuwenhoekiella aestuarii]